MKKKILIVDDHSGFTKIVKVLLEATKSYEVLEVNNPAMATQVALEFCPDAVLLDVDMPNLDCGDVLALFRNDPLLKKIPVMFVTGSVLEREVALNNGRIGGEIFIAKPVSAKTFIESIEEAIKLGDPSQVLAR
jgi:CheY-like chemotaxis protein